MPTRLAEYGYTAPEAMMTSDRHRAYLDRIEGSVAVLLAPGDPEAEWHVPTSWLPAGAREGAWLIVNLEVDSETSTRAAARNAHLRRRLERP